VVASLWANFYAIINYIGATRQKFFKNKSKNMPEQTLGSFEGEINREEGGKNEKIDLEAAKTMLGEKSASLAEQIKQEPDLNPETRANKLDLLEMAQAQVEKLLETILGSDLEITNAITAVFEYIKNPNNWLINALGTAIITFESIKNDAPAYLVCVGFAGIPLDCLLCWVMLNKREKQQSLQSEGLQ
jgi:hypothetical protein